MSVKERCRNSLIKFADMGIISAMVACIKDGINAEKYIEALADMSEIYDEDNSDDIAKAINAAKEGYRLADKVFAQEDDIGRLK